MVHHDRYVGSQVFIHDHSRQHVPCTHVIHTRIS